MVRSELGTRNVEAFYNFPCFIPSHFLKMLVLSRVFMLNMCGNSEKTAEDLLSVLQN